MTAQELELYLNATDVGAFVVVFHDDKTGRLVVNEPDYDAPNDPALFQRLFTVSTTATPEDAHQTMLYGRRMYAIGSEDGGELARRQIRGALGIRG